MASKYDLIDASDDALAAFSAKCSLPNENGCILWHRAESQVDGYGRFYFDNRKYPAHRMAWIFKNGEIPQGLFVCHTCDVRLCVNCDHLFLGTNRDNVDDMIRKGRNAFFPCPNRDRPSRAKLTVSQVISIMARAGAEKSADLAREFSISRNTIRQIATGKRWKHLSASATAANLSNTGAA